MTNLTKREATTVGVENGKHNHVNCKRTTGRIVNISALSDGSSDGRDNWHLERAPITPRFEMGGKNHEKGPERAIKIRGKE